MSPASGKIGKSRSRIDVFHPIYSFFPANSQRNAKGKLNDLTLFFSMSMFCYHDSLSPAAMLVLVVAVTLVRKQLAGVGDVLAELGSTCHMNTSK